MKCNDDTFLHVPNLLHILLGGTVPAYEYTHWLYKYDFLHFNVLSDINRLNLTERILLGCLRKAEKPYDFIAHKYYMPQAMYPLDTYPDFLSGIAYVMSMDVVPILYETALNTSYIHLEDVFLTGICADKANITRLHNILFQAKIIRYNCTSKGIITLHDLKDNDMKYIYKNSLDVHQNCKPYVSFRFHTSKPCL